MMTSDQEQKRIITSSMDYIDQVVKQCAAEILKYTPKLYTKEPNQIDNIEPDPVASGVLLKVKGQYFLITAGHVLKENNPEDIGIMIGRNFIILKGDIRYVDPSKSYQNSRIDIAVWKIDDNVAKELETRYRFLPFEKIDFQHKIEREPKYLIVGFTWRETIIDDANQKLISSPLIFLANEAKKEYYKKLGFKEQSNLLLNYTQHAVVDIGTRYVHKNQSPEGVSGCGVWYIPKFFNADGNVPDFKLVGQIIEQAWGETILISTRIHLVKEILHRGFGLNIPHLNN